MVGFADRGEVTFARDSKRTVHYFHLVVAHRILRLLLMQTWYAARGPPGKLTAQPVSRPILSQIRKCHAAGSTSSPAF